MLRLKNLVKEGTKLLKKYWMVIDQGNFIRRSKAYIFTSTKSLKKIYIKYPRRVMLVLLIKVDEKKDTRSKER